MTEEGLQNQIKSTKVLDILKHMVFLKARSAKKTVIYLKYLSKLMMEHEHIEGRRSKRNNLLNNFG